MTFNGLSNIARLFNDGNRKAATQLAAERMFDFRLNSHYSIYFRKTTRRKVTIMPRKAPDVVNEHRITFGTYERNAIIEPLEQTINNAARVTQVAAVAGSVGAVAAGTGVVLAAYGFWRWLGASPLEEFKETFTETIQKVGKGTVDVLNNDIVGTNDDVLRQTFEEIFGEGALTFNDLRRIRNEALARKNRVCLVGSNTYDAAACEIATHEYQVANHEVLQAVRTIKETKGIDNPIQASWRIFKAALTGKESDAD